MLRCLAATLACLPLGACGLGGASTPPPTFHPDDPGYLQYGSLLDPISAPAYWAAIKDKPCSVKVAVVDSGVSAVSDLQLALAGQPQRNFWPGGGADDAFDQFGHGTKVASVVSAAIDNGIGTAGLSNCPIVPAKVMGPDGRWTSDWLKSAIDWAAGQPGVKVINASLWETAGESIWPPLKQAIESAADKGILVVLIAGNGVNNAGVTVGARGSADPAANPLAAAFAGNPRVIRVAGADPNGALNAHSNYGASLADIAAPFTLPVELPDGGWRLNGGTSFAAPAVSAIAAEMFNANPALTADQAKSILMNSCTKVIAIDVRCGGVVDAYEALRAAGDQTAPATYTLTVTHRGDGTVSASPRQAAYVGGSTVTLTAKPKPRWRFNRWLGLCRGGKPVCRLTISRSGTVTAVFWRK